MSLTAAEIAVVLSLDPLLQSLALAHRQACLAQGVPFVFRSGYRSFGHQLLLYELNVTLKDLPGIPELRAQHPEFKATTPAKPGTSKHERAAAYDADHGNDLQTVVFGQEAEKLGLRWGGRFQHADGTPSPDYEHCELPHSLAELDTWRALRAYRLVVEAQ